MEQIRIIKEMRERDKSNGKSGVDVFPRFLIWENVHGAFSSNGGEDFRVVLEEIARVAEPGAVVPRYEGGRWHKAGTIIGVGYSLAWRTVDAQYWGTPQRRRRIALVADFNGILAPEVLFERDIRDEPRSQIYAIGDGMSRDFEPGGEAGKGFAGGTSGGFGETGGALNPWDTQSERIFPEGTPQKAAVCIQGNVVDRDAKMNGSGISEGVSPTLNGVDRHAVYDARGNGDGVICPTIMGDHENRVTDYTAVCVGTGDPYIAGTLDASYYKGAGARNGAERTFVSAGSVVRRLTPLECERLQGYPDGWTDIGDWIDSRGQKRKTSDAARYKALGNSIAIPFWYWLLQRVSGVCAEKTMGSLFDGIGGFPLCWESINGEGSCRWASEIEPFCIAVTNRHFGDEETGERGDLYEIQSRG